MDKFTEQGCIDSVAWAISTVKGHYIASGQKERYPRMKLIFAEHHNGLTSAYGLVTFCHGDYGVAYNLDFENHCDCCGAMPQLGSIDIPYPIGTDEEAGYSKNVIDAGKYIFEKLGNQQPSCDCNIRFARRQL